MQIFFFFLEVDYIRGGKLYLILCDGCYGDDWMQISVYVCKTSAQVLIRDQRQGLMSVGEMAKKTSINGENF